MASQPEKEHSKKWAEKIAKRYGVWTDRFVDTPMIRGGGFVSQKKPMDRIIVVRGIAVEAKWVTGKSFNLATWRTKKATRHQYIDIKKYGQLGIGPSILLYCWKETGKRDIRFKFNYWDEIGPGVDSMNMEDAHDSSELDEWFEQFMESWI